MKSMLLDKLKKAGTMVLAAICLVGLGAWGVLAVDGQNADPALPGANQLTRPGDPPPRAQGAGEGRLMIFRDGGLATMNPNGKELRWVLEKDDKVLLHPFFNGSLSHDGKRLALLVLDREAIEAAKDKKGTQKAIAHVHIRDVSEKGVGQKLGLTGVMCIWSGDGAKLLVTDMDEKPGEFTAKSWMVNLKTKEKTALALPKNHLVCDWSRDSQWLLACVVEPGKSRLVMEKQDGSEAYDVTAPGPFVLGKLAPNGKKILYLSQKAGKNREQELLVQSLPKAGKAEPVRLSALNHDILGFTWSPDGGRVAYTCKIRPDAGEKERPGPEESFLIIVNADGTNMVTAQTQKGAVPLGSLEWR